jgi:hypothetical protein
MSKRKPLLENHPTRIKFQKLEEFANELGIGLSFNEGASTLQVHDEDYPGTVIMVEDLEGPDHGIYDFPGVFETALIKIEREKE